MKVWSVLGNEYHGALGKSIIAETWHGINYIKKYAVPRNPRTARQQVGRRRFADAVAAWQALPPDDRRRYDLDARNLGCSGYNLFISRFLAGDAASAGKSTP